MEQALVKVNEFLINFLKTHFAYDLVERLDENNNDTEQYNLDDENRSLFQLEEPSQTAENWPDSSSSVRNNSR